MNRDGGRESVAASSAPIAEALRQSQTEALTAILGWISLRERAIEGSLRVLLTE